MHILYIQYLIATLPKAQAQGFTSDVERIFGAENLT
jgi:hypothetical protein